MHGTNVKKKIILCLCLTQLHITVKYIQILSVVHQWFYGILFYWT